MIIIKLALVAGTVWITKKIGVWDNPDTTAAIFEDIKCKLNPYVDDLKLKYCSKYCKTSEKNTMLWRETFVEAWNASIKEGFLVVNRFPKYCLRFTDDVNETISQFFNGISRK